MVPAWCMAHGGVTLPLVLYNPAAYHLLLTAFYFLVCTPNAELVTPNYASKFGCFQGLFVAFSQT
jgi:hypothetical protein